MLNSLISKEHNYLAGRILEDLLTESIFLKQNTVLIVGQGICGTWLSYHLHKAGIPILVIDQNGAQSASKIASGIINPVTGRRHVKTWMIDEVMPFAVDAYRTFGEGIEAEFPPKAEGYIRQCDILDFFSAPDVELAFNKRVGEGAAYLCPVPEREYWLQQFQFHFGIGSIKPCYLADVNGVLDYWRDFLVSKNLYIAGDFHDENLVLTDDGIVYNDIEAKMVVFCNGIAGSASGYFDRLPFAASKGEALIAAIPNIVPTNIFKKGMSLVPWQPGQYWIGSSYEWKFDDHLPSVRFRENAASWLRSFVKTDYEIVDHVAAVRPATVERRPFVGFHPVYGQVGIFNGMGTKGVSLAPYFALHFAEHIAKGTPLMAEVDVRRFSRILSR